MPRWNFDPDHTVAAFAVKHLDIAIVRGQFNQIGGGLAFDPDNPAELGLEVNIAVAGLYSGIKKRDVHLFSPDFFDAVNFPEISFRGAGGYSPGKWTEIAGQLTIRGTTRPLALEMALTGPFKLPADFGGETTIGFSARAQLDRRDFGLNWNMPLGGGSVLVGNQVEITLDGEADREEGP